MSEIVFTMDRVENKEEEFSWLQSPVAGPVEDSLTSELDAAPVAVAKKGCACGPTVHAFKHYSLVIYNDRFNQNVPTGKSDEKISRNPVTSSEQEGFRLATFNTFRKKTGELVMPTFDDKGNRILDLSKNGPYKTHKNLAAQFDSFCGVVKK